MKISKKELINLLLFSILTSFFSFYFFDINTVINTIIEKTTLKICKLDEKNLINYYPDENDLNLTKRKPNILKKIILASIDGNQCKKIDSYYGIVKDFKDYNDGNIIYNTNRDSFSMYNLYYILNNSIFNTINNDTEKLNKIEGWDILAKMVKKTLNAEFFFYGDTFNITFHNRNKEVSIENAVEKNILLLENIISKDFNVQTKKLSDLIKNNSFYELADSIVIVAKLNEKTKLVLNSKQYWKYQAEYQFELFHYYYNYLNLKYNLKNKPFNTGCYVVIDVDDTCYKIANYEKLNYLEILNLIPEKFEKSNSLPTLLVFRTYFEKNKKDKNYKYITIFLILTIINFFLLGIIKKIALKLDKLSMIKKIKIKLLNLYNKNVNSKDIKYFNFCLIISGINILILHSYKGFIKCLFNNSCLASYIRVHVFNEWIPIITLWILYLIIIFIFRNKIINYIRKLKKSFFEIGIFTEHYIRSGFYYFHSTFRILQI